MYTCKFCVHWMTRSIFTLPALGKETLPRVSCISLFRQTHLPKLNKCEDILDFHNNFTLVCIVFYIGHLLKFNAKPYLQVETSALTTKKAKATTKKKENEFPYACAVFCFHRM